MTSEIIEIENRKNKQCKSINETKNPFFEKVNKIDKHLGRLANRRKSTNIRNVNRISRQTLQTLKG